MDDGKLFFNGENELESLQRQKLASGFSTKKKKKKGKYANSNGCSMTKYISAGVFRRVIQNYLFSYSPDQILDKTSKN